MGNSNLKGYRILYIKPNSPFDQKAEPYFDFIVDIITDPSPRQILDKLSNSQPKEPLANMMLKVRENVNKPVVFKIFSNKTQKVREIEIVPSNQWGEKEDLLGIEFRLEDPRVVRENYCRITEVQVGSPAAKARLVNDEYLIACQQIRYNSINQLVDSMHEILYSQQVQNKSITFITYNIFTDQLSSHKIQLVRKWGGKGIVGCEFLEGHVYRFPDNLEEIRARYKEKDMNLREVRAMQRELLNSDGVSRRLAENLKKKGVKKDLMFKEPPSFRQPVPSPSPLERGQTHESMNSQAINAIINRFQSKFDYFQKRLETIESFLENLCEIEKEEVVEPVQLLPEETEGLGEEKRRELVTVPDRL